MKKAMIVYIFSFQIGSHFNLSLDTSNLLYIKGSGTCRPKWVMAPPSLPRRLEIKVYVKKHLIPSLKWWWMAIRCSPNYKCLKFNQSPLNFSLSSRHSYTLCVDTKILYVFKKFRTWNGGSIERSSTHTQRSWQGPWAQDNNNPAMRLCTHRSDDKRCCVSTGKHHALLTLWRTYVA